MNFYKQFRIRFFLLFAGLIFGTNGSAITIDVSDSPTNDLQLALSAIDSAQHSLYVNAYEFTSNEIANHIIDKIRSGIKVEILAEGQPVGGIGKVGESIRAQVVQAMAQATAPDRFFVMSSEEPDGANQRRFHFDHAKYMIVDEANILVGSENYSPTGNPAMGSLAPIPWSF